MLYHICDCIWTDVLQTHIRLCPWERSQLEPLCIHTLLTTIYIYTYINIYIYVYILSQIGSYMNPCGSSSHMFMLLRVLTLRTSWYTCIYSQVYIYHIADTFVDEPMLCKVTYVCPCKCSNQDPLARTCQDHGLRQIFAASNNLRIYVYFSSYVCTSIYCSFCESLCASACVEFTLGHSRTCWFFPKCSISHWAFCPKSMAIRACKHCRNRAAKLKWQ